MIIQNMRSVLAGKPYRLIGLALSIVLIQALLCFNCFQSLRNDDLLCGEVLFKYQINRNTSLVVIVGYEQMPAVFKAYKPIMVGEGIAVERNLALSKKDIIPVIMEILE